MNRFLYAGLSMLFIFAVLFAFPTTVLANEGAGEHQLEVEVNGYHVTLASQNEWIKGEDVLVVTITDSMGMPVSDANVEILVTPKDEHAEADTQAQESSMPGMGMDTPATETSAMPGMGMGEPAATETPNLPAHDEASASPVAMMESEHGKYTVDTHLESAGEYNVHVMFHVNGELMQADFVVEVVGAGSKTIVLWSFAAINVAAIATAGVMKKQKTITVKGA